MKVLFISVILLLTNSFLNAANYIDEFPTYTYGDIRPIAAIYNAIAMITDSDVYQNLIKLALLFSVVSIGWLMTFQKDVVSSFKSGAFTVGTIAVLLVPVDVHLVDKRLDKGLITNYYHDNTLGYEKISNVPWLIALTPSIATTISSDLIELADLAFKGNTVNYPGMKDIGKTGFSELGYNKAYDMLNKIIDKYSFDEIGTLEASNFKKDFKIYLVDCVIPKTVSNSLVTTKLINPDKDIYTSISPTEIGLTNTDEVNKRDGTITDCVSYYNEIIANLKNLSTDSYSTMSKIAGTPDIKQITGINNIMLADIQSTVFSNTTEQLAIYAQNLAAAPLIKATIEDYYRGTGMSGQEIANSITAAKSTASLQTQGLGQFKWMAQILPYAMHFLFGIVLAASIFTLIMILARGSYQGTAIAKNYFGGFIQFEAIRVSLAIVNNLVMYYATIGAADKLVEFGGNPLAAIRLPAYLDYIATMEGVSGILAISAIFLIPAIAMKGDVASIASSMQSLAGKYIGNDVDTARDAISKSSARQRAVGNIMNDEQAMKKLDQMGLSVPKERMPLEYYNAVTNDLATMSSGIGNMLSQDKMNNFSKGTVAGTVSKVSNTAGYGSSVNLSSADNVSYQDGQAQGHQTNATETYRNKAGWDANSVGTGRAIQSVGKDLTAMATTDLASENGFDSYAKGSYNQGAMATAKTQGAGGINLSTDDLNKIGDTVKASIQSEIGKGAGVQENYKKYGDDTYKTSAEYGERSGMAKTMEKLRAQSGVDNSVNIDANESMMKAYQQTGSVDGSMEAYNRKSRTSGRTFGEVIEALSKDLSEGKTSSDIATVDSANANGGYVNFQERSAREKTTTAIASLKGLENAGKIDASGTLTEVGNATVTALSEGKAASEMRTVSEYNLNNKENGGYVGAQKDNASIKAGQDIGNLNAQRSKGFINDEGLTGKGIDSYGISPMEQASGLDGKYDTFYGKNAQTSANNVVNGLRETSKRSAEMEASNLASEKKLNKEQTKNFVDSYVQAKMQEVDKKLQELGMLNENNEVQSGDAMVGALAKMGSMNYASSKSLTFDGQNISMGIDSSTGQAKVFNSNSSSNVNGGNANTFNSLSSAITGSKKTFNNDVMELNNSNPLTTLAMKRFDGDIKKAAAWARSAEGAKWALDPRNEISLAAAETALHLTPDDKQNDNGEMNAMIGTGLGAGGLGLYLANKMTQKPVKMDTGKLNEVKDDTGNIKGFANDDGKIVADRNGFQVNENGEKVKKGAVGRTSSKTWEKIKDSAMNLGEELSPFSRKEESSKEAVKGSTDSSSNNNNNEPKNSTSDHNESPISKNNNNYSRENNAEPIKSEVKHPKIENFMTEAEAKTSGALDMFKKMPFIGKAAAIGLAGVTMAQAKEEFDNGNYAKALFTATSIADVTGGSDMALATIESRELLDKATAGRKVTGIGKGWKDDLMNSSIGQQVKGAYDSVNEIFSNSSQSGQQLNTNNFSNMLRDGQVRNELSGIYKEQFEQNKMASGNEEQMQKLNMMEMKNSVDNVKEQMKTISDINISNDELEQLKKDLKKMRMK
jgi:hypothetical protein